MATYAVDVPDDIALRWSRNIMTIEEPEEIDAKAVSAALAELVRLYAKFPRPVGKREEAANAIVRAKVVELSSAMGPVRDSYEAGQRIDRLMDFVLGGKE